MISYSKVFHVRHRFIIKLSFVFSHTTDIWGERAKIERRSSAHQPTSTKDWVNFSVKMTENNLWNVDYSIISSKNHYSQRNWGFQIENNFSIKLLNSLAITTWMCIRTWKPRNNSVRLRGIAGLSLRLTLWTNTSINIDDSCMHILITYFTKRYRSAKLRFFVNLFISSVFEN